MSLFGNWFKENIQNPVDQFGSNLWNDSIGGFGDLFSGIDLGDTIKLPGDFIKELTGAAAAERALEFQKKQVAQEKVNRLQLLADERVSRRRADVSASNATQSIRSTAQANAGGSFGFRNFQSSGSLLGNPLNETNFLGL